MTVCGGAGLLSSVSDWRREEREGNLELESLFLLLIQRLRVSVLWWLLLQACLSLSRVAELSLLFRVSGLSPATPESNLQMLFVVLGSVILSDVANFILDNQWEP